MSDLPCIPNISFDDQEYLVRMVLSKVSRARGHKPFGISSIQREFHIGYNRAARIRDYGLMLGVIKESVSAPYLIEMNK